MIRRLIGRCIFLVTVVGVGGAWASTDDGLELDALRGRVVYVDFWASWCGPCRESFPWMKEMQQRYGDRGLVVVGINVDQDRELANQFLNAFRPQFRIVFDADAKLAEEFHVAGMPASYFIDRSGKQRFRHVGFRQAQRSEYEQELKSLLAEQ
jgi:cytochrome c biogenesis protein CcmG, thiol:disulfide interchange protein DsbE